MRKPKVLMLGWEFPPVISGGLGIACHGIAKALAKCTDLTVILPKSDNNYQPPGFKIMGLDRMDIFGPIYANEITNGYGGKMSINKYSEFAQVLEVGIGFNPYHLSKDSSENDSFAILDYLKSTTNGSQNPFEMHFGQFNIGKLYGDDVISKVIEYSYYVTAAAAKMDFDVIHGHDWMTVLAGLQLKYATGKPFVMHVHATTYDRGGPDARGWVYDIEKFGMEHADAVIPVSNYTAGIVENHFGISRDKIFPVHNGIEPVEVFKEEKQFPEKLVLFLGRVTGQKGPEYFLDIAAKVLEKNKDVRFVMAGNGDQLRGVIERNANKHLSNKFHFTGFLNREKVNKLLAMADVYCMPSVSEPFGLSAVEAAQFGIPAVISKQSGVSEVLVNSLMADFWDVDLMAKHICDLLNDEDLRKNVVAKTKEDLKNVTWDRTSNDILKVYAGLIDEPIEIPAISPIETPSTNVEATSANPKVSVLKTPKKELATTTTTTTGKVTFKRNQKFEPKTTYTTISRRIVNIERIEHKAGTEIKNKSGNTRKIDDLTIIDQIDKQIEKILNKYHIYSFEDIAILQIEALRKVIKADYTGNQKLDLEMWIQKARERSNFDK